MTMSGPRPPLDGLRALDLTRARAGPTCARQLADWGADVIKIEPPARPDAPESITGERHDYDFQNLHRNKRGLTLNLKAPEGRDLFLRLAGDADVVIENYRPDVKRRLGIDYEAVRAVNPRIVYGSVSGFGQEGPYRDRPGLDQIAQGLGGLMSITGLPGQGPVRAGIPLADLSAGMLLAQGVLLALFERERSGEGQWVHTSLLEAQIQMLDFQAARWLIAGEVAPQAGNDHPTSIPTSVFPTADGHINIAASGAVLWERLCHALGLPELIAMPEYATGELRSRNRASLNARIAAVTPARASADWIAALNEAGVPCGPINAIDAVFADPQARTLDMDRPVAHPILGDIRVVGQAINLARTPQPPAHGPAPELGEHSDAILRGLGLGADAIRGLRERGVV